MAKVAIVLNPKDNVAVALQDIKAGSEVELKIGPQNALVTIGEPINFGHKFSLKHIEPGEPIVKYGEVIGEATAAIEPGYHVHLHNLASRRGRGDLLKESK